jgi:hypothetical protein
MPANLTDDATQFPTVTTPSGADVPNAASVQTSLQQLANRTAFLQALGLSGKIFEGFESVTFPPASPGGFWSAPSTRFNTDFAYQRDTSNPITGTASANRNTGQTATSNSSLGLSNVYLDSPARIAFVFDLLCNASFGDHLDFYIDGVLTAKYSCTTNATVSAGRFVSDVLREGVHTFDWRFVRGGSVSVASEKARVDAVNIIPESVWSDPTTRFSFFDDLVYTSVGLVTGPPQLPPFYHHASSANAGTFNWNWTGSTVFFHGSPKFTCSATAIGDYYGVTLGDGMFGTGSAAAYAPFLETMINLPSIANMFVEFGFAGGAGIFTDYLAAWVYDSSVGTDWRFKTINASTVTTNPTGVAAAAGVATRLSVSGLAGLTNGNGWLGLINGQALPGAGANHMGSTQNMPTGAAGAYVPYLRVGSRTAAAAKIVEVDYLKLLALRGTALIG